jgi:hypothetical protein
VRIAARSTGKPSLGQTSQAVTGGETRSCRAAGTRTCAQPIRRQIHRDPDSTAGPHPGANRSGLVGLRRVSPLLMGLRVEIDRGLVLLVAAPYDDTIVDWIRTLPERRCRRESQDWIMPARRERLRTLCSLIGELENAASTSRSARTPARASRAWTSDEPCYATASSRSWAHTANAGCRRCAYARAPL